MPGGRYSTETLFVIVQGQILPCGRVWSVCGADKCQMSNTNMDWL